MALVAAPAVQAADTFVDSAIGSDGNSCTSAGAACATIAAGIAKAGSGDTIGVGPGIYAEQVALGDGKSLRATGTAASTVIDSSASPAIDVTSNAGTIEGFTLRAEGSDLAGVVRLGAAATVRGNVFDQDEDDPPPPPAPQPRPMDLEITDGAGSPSITENTFTDDGDGYQIAIATRSTSSPIVGDNLIKGFFEGVEVTGGTTGVSRNVITATHNSSSLGQGSGIAVFSGPGNVAPTVTANLIQSSSGPGTPNGVGIFDFVSGPGNPTVTATLRRNRIIGGAFGVDAFGTLPTVTLDSDLITGASVLGLRGSEVDAPET